VGAIILGKMHLRWCSGCGVPVLESRTCGKCGLQTVEVRLTPPGDARPAFPADLERLRRLIDHQFGEGTGIAAIPRGCIVLLNKAPDIDRTDEVIIGGAVAGARRFSILGDDKFMPRPATASAIAPTISRNWVVVDDVAATAIREKKASTLAVGVESCAEGIEAGDDIIVLDQHRKPVSVGVAKMSSAEMREHRRGTAVKTRWAVPVNQTATPEAQASWNDVLDANEPVLRRRIDEAKQFVLKTVGENKLPVAVSYSGGKDSLATLLLVLDAGIRPSLLFVDTGLEFMQTKDNVAEVARRYGLDVVMESAGDSFWKNLRRFGPPAKDFRWCCKTCKLGPATQLIQRNFPDGVLSFIGQRAYESQQRAEKGRVWRNPWTPNQLAASPIQKWTALHVWLYLMSKEAPVNPLYEKGLERIGCFMCPASDLAELRLVKEICPEYARWQEALNAICGERSIGSTWLKYDLWRWKRIPKSVLDELGLSETDSIGLNEERAELEFHSTSGYNPCVEGLSMEGVFTRPLDMDRVANMMNIIGEVTISPDGGIAEARSVTVFREGPVMIKAKDEKELAEKGSRLREIVLRAMGCAGCGICTSRCPTGALHLDGQVVVDQSKCTHCAACLGPCPAVRFAPDQIDI
jgi:phosphoadenosine phosphosulfate reductase